MPSGTLGAEGLPSTRYRAPLAGHGHRFAARAKTTDPEKTATVVSVAVNRTNVPKER